MSIENAQCGMVQKNVATIQGEGRVQHLETSPLKSLNYVKMLLNSFDGEE